VSEIERGQSLVGPGAFAATRVVDARLEVLGSAKPVRHGARVRFHQGTSEVLGRVALSSLVFEHDGESGAAFPASEVPPGRSAYVRLRLEAPVVVTRRDRFVLRAYSPSITVAGGVVLDPQPPRGGIRTVAGRRRFNELDPARLADAGAADERAVLVLAAEGACAGLPLASLMPRLGLETDTQRALLARLHQTAAIRQIGGALMSAPLLQRMADDLTAILTRHHQAQPLSDGMNREEMRERVFAHAAPGVFEQVLTDLTRAGAIVATDRLALATHRVAAAGPEAEARDRVDACYRDAGLKPPDAQEAATALGLPKPLVDAMIALLVRQRGLVKIDTLVFHHSSLMTLIDQVRQIKAAAGGSVARLDVAAFKERYGMTRKFAIPLLEYLDRERVTRRVGDSRVVI
jgi:selenocysteine-specific elongation factor